MKRLFFIDAYQGKGIGKTLINMLLEEAKKKGYKKIRLDSLKKMEDAQRLYRQFGFYEIAQYVENSIEGTIFMEKSL
ncbi:acetyltransferase [Candidatus Moduliflexus flocculans]|uniref:Acetyltransferase n=1 Tax=Candidatus Moduliflexus flocculans TaxID=1499966 RepID=A0A081BLG1_9BACT|nr:acetyltransferase [Candidatus Moduliflexus flocculans]